MPELAYIPAPGSPTRANSQKDAEDDDDPLDAYMAGIEKQASLFPCVSYNYSFFLINR